MEICYKSVLKCEENIRKMLKDFGLSNMIGDAIAKTNTILDLEEE